MRINNIPEKIAASVADSAESIGISVSQFRRLYIATGLCKPVDLGGRSPAILQAQLREAVANREAEQAANPGGVTARSSGAKLKAQGRIGNPWGRFGKDGKGARK